MDNDFLNDLDDLSDDEPEQPVPQAVPEQDDLDRDVDMVKVTSVHAIAKLVGTPRYKQLVTQVHELKDLTPEQMLAHPDMCKPSEDDPLLTLVVDLNKLNVDIDDEIEAIHKFIVDNYTTKFPDLHQMVKHPVDYARVVKCIGNEEDITRVEGLEELLPSATVMVVSVTASTSNGQPLPTPVMAATEEACDMCLELDATKTATLSFVESLMGRAAPNLSAAVGSRVAASLIGAAGGIKILMGIPACNIQVLGQKKHITAGLSTATAAREGFVYDSPIMQNTPPSLRTKAARLVGGKAALLARVDAFRQSPGGEAGRRMLEEMQAKIEKWQEPNQARTVKALKVPDAEPKKRRGGKRVRKLKEKTQMTEVHKASNRVGFNQQEEEVFDGDESVGLGQLGAAATGRLRIATSSAKIKVSKRHEKRLKQVASTMVAGGDSTVSGMQTSLSFAQGGSGTASTFVLHQKLGLDSMTPSDTQGGTESYFNDLGGFKSILPPPK